MASAIVVRDLHKTYGDVRAVDGISFEVLTGEFFGILGPNGAGKTTTLEIIEGLRQADSGEVRVFDLDPQARRNLWDLLRGINTQGRTIVLTTHYMDEAETLCDRVAIMDEGRILELGPPAVLVRGLDAPTRISIESGLLPVDDAQILS